MINKIFLFGCNAINEKKQNITFYGKFSIKFFFSSFTLLSGTLLGCRRRRRFSIYSNFRDYYVNCNLLFFFLSLSHIIYPIKMLRTFDLMQMIEGVYVCVFVWTMWKHLLWLFLICTEWIYIWRLRLCVFVWMNEWMIEYI